MLTREDKAKRVGKITSSVAAACLGIDEHMSQIDAWLRIRGEGPGDDEMSPAMRKACERGNRLEEYILSYPSDLLDLVYTPAPFRSAAPWAGDSCDALYWLDNGHVSAYDPYRDLQGIGEGKSASQMIGCLYGEEDTDEVPNHTLIQSHWHLIHWPETNICHVPVLVGGYKFEFRRYVVERDAEFEGILWQDLERWHRDYIIGDKPPPVGAGDDSWIKTRYPRAKPGVAIPDTDELRELAFEKCRAAAAKKAAESREDLAKNRLRELMGEAEECRASWGSVTWRNNSPSLTTDFQRLAFHLFDELGLNEAARNELVAEHTTEKPGPRVLRVTPNKQTKKELGL